MSSSGKIHCMNDDKNILTKSHNTLITSQTGQSLTRAKSFKVTSQTPNYAQYVRTVKAYALAGLPFEHIANAGDTLGDLVERGEIDAPISEMEGKMGEIVEDESKMLAWQNRGVKVSKLGQLTTGVSVTGKEVVTISQSVTTNQQGEQTINVIEGIGVFNQQTPQIQNTTPSNSSSHLENNPYLRAPADLKKI